MGLKNILRGGSKKSRSSSSQKLPPRAPTSKKAPVTPSSLPAIHQTGNGGPSEDNSTIATKESPRQPVAAANPGRSPNYEREVVPPQSLPPLGLVSCGEDVNQVGSGSLDVIAQQLPYGNGDPSRHQRGESIGSDGGTIGSGSIFAGLTVAPTGEAAASGGGSGQYVELRHLEPSRRAREPTPTDHHGDGARARSRSRDATVRQNGEDEMAYRSKKFDPPALTSDPPPAEVVQGRGRKSSSRHAATNNNNPPPSPVSKNKSKALKVAMRREITRHRGGPAPPPARVVAPRGANKASSSRNSARKGAVNVEGMEGMQRIGDIPRPSNARGGRSGHKAEVENASRGSGQGSGSATNSRGKTSSNRGRKAAAAAAAVGAAAAASSRTRGLSLRRNKQAKNNDSYEDDSQFEDSQYGDDPPSLDERTTEETESVDFPEVGNDDDDDDDYDKPRSRSRSRGRGPARSRLDDDYSVEETGSLLQDAESFCSCGGGTYQKEDEYTANEGTLGTYDDNTYVGEESYVNETSFDHDDDESYVDSLADDGTYQTYNSDDDDDDATRQSVDPPAKDATWASWFGFGGGEGGNNRAGIDTVMSPSYDDGDDDDGSTKSGGSTVGTRDDATADEAATQGDQAGRKDPAASSGKKDGAAISSSVHDREGRPLPMRKVPSFKNSWKKLKNGGGTDGSVSKGKDNDASVVTPATAATASESASRGDASADKSKSSAAAAEAAANAETNKNMDADVRQRDIYCSKIGTVDNLVIRQYEGVPTPNAPDHVLVKIEASTVSSKDCVIRLMGDPNAAPSPSVPGFHIVGEVHAIGDEVTSSSFRRGDRIAALLPNGGGNAKYISIPSSSAILLPENSHHDDIICLVANYMTAYQCLKLAKKDGLPLTNANVLITGGSGPVGQALVELALREGAKVYATAHKMHEEHLTKLGAKWFSVKPKKWLPYLEGKMDVVIDSLCVDGYESSYRALTDDGMLVCNTGNSSAELKRDESGQSFCNVLDPDSGISHWWSTTKARYFWKRAIFYDLNDSYEKNPKMFGHELHYLICKLQRGEIKPKVAGKVSLNQVPKAQKLIEKGLPNGIVVCLPWKKLDPKQKVKIEKAD